MKIITFESKSSQGSGIGSRIGVLVDDDQYVLDFRSALGAQAPSELLAWFDLDGEWASKAAALYDEVERDTNIKDNLKEQGAIISFDDVKLLAPVPRPGKLLCVGLNYREHVAEGNREEPANPILFSKFTTSITGPGGQVVLPPTSNEVDYEAELAVIIGRRAKGVPREQALNYIFGYMNLNDVSARDFQFGDG